MVKLTFFDGIGVLKTSESKKCDTFHYWYFLDEGCKFKPDVCNGCHNLSMISMNYYRWNIIVVLSAESPKMRLCKTSIRTNKAEHYKTLKNCYHISKWVKKF